MADLHKAEAAAREAYIAEGAKFVELDDKAEPLFRPLGDLLAALDAARGEAVALDAFLAESRKAREEMRARLDAVDVAGESIQDLPDLARVYRAGFEAGRNAAPPAAAVPEGYAEAIKAVQEMMPPRDFRPSAQVWLTGNQVNELHARLDAAAMLAAAERKGD